MGRESGPGKTERHGSRKMGEGGKPHERWRDLKKFTILAIWERKRQMKKTSVRNRKKLFWGKKARRDLVTQDKVGKAAGPAG